MSITVQEDIGLFSLNTDHTTYQFFADNRGYLRHLYYGQRIGTFDMRYREFYSDCGFSPNPGDSSRDRTFSMDTRSMEYTGCGIGDYRIGCLSLSGPDGSYSADFRYTGYEIVPGKERIPGLPSSYAAEAECDTLHIFLRDGVTGLQLQLNYSVFPQMDFITRSAVLKNGSVCPIQLYKIASACLDLPFGSWELIHFHGRHCMERQPERLAVPHAAITLGSDRGASSHQHNPFAILAAPETGEDFGECLGAMLVYSGNYKIEAECSQLESTRLVLGISDTRFCWTLNPEECFYTPEVLLSFTKGGLSALSRQYHRFLSRHICRGPYRDALRPVLINNWEATYFRFTGEKLLEIARQAKSLGVELLVLDDGWFGKRDSDLSGLGDWTVNEKKLGCSLDALIAQVREIGLDFGIWVEPEMVSPDSDLYRAHPDWALTVPGRAPTQGRSQLVLDLGREEVVEYLFDVFYNLFRRHDIRYVKWDMNRHITDAYSRALPPHRQGEASHRYMLGLYRLLEKLTGAFPNILFEGCSGGGGRMDAGMLCYFSQYWCSDDTDAIERLKIQYGTSFGYPIRTVGSHVSASPNHQTGRSTPLKTRGIVAMSGTFGYELDPSKLAEPEKEEIRAQIQAFHRYQPLVFDGDYYRLTNAMTDTFFTAWEFAAQDGSEALLNVVVTDPRVNPSPIHIRLKGLLPEARYRQEDTEQIYSGAALLYGGYTLPIMQGDYPSFQTRFVRIS